MGERVARVVVVALLAAGRRVALAEAMRRAEAWRGWSITGPGSSAVEAGG